MVILAKRNYTVCTRCIAKVQSICVFWMSTGTFNARQNRHVGCVRFRRRLWLSPFRFLQITCLMDWLFMQGTYVITAKKQISLWKDHTCPDTVILFKTLPPLSHSYTNLEIKQIPQIQHVLVIRREVKIEYLGYLIKNLLLISWYQILSLFKQPRLCLAPLKTVQIANPRPNDRKKATR